MGAVLHSGFALRSSCSIPCQPCRVTRGQHFVFPCVPLGTLGCSGQIGLFLSLFSLKLIEICVA